MKKIDLNCDVGESYSAWTMGCDEKIMPYIQSANIACGFHAGDPKTMRETVALALKYGVKIGAHPGLNDKNGFGRRNIPITPQEAYDLVLVQIGALDAVVRSQGGTLFHVKPHGALYNMSCNNTELSKAIAQAIIDFNPSLTLFALSGSLQIKIAQDMGLKVMNEVFADRTYQDDGTLTPRIQSNALIKEVEQAIAQVHMMITQQKVQSTGGKIIPIKADTLCLHGDSPSAVEFSQSIAKIINAQSLKC